MPVEQGPAASHRPAVGQQGECLPPVELVTGWVEPLGQASRAVELGRRGRRVGVAEPRAEVRACGLWARRRI